MIKRTLYNFKNAHKISISICSILIFLFIIDSILSLQMGIEFSVIHWIYIPIIIVALVFDIKMYKEIHLKKLFYDMNNGLPNASKLKRDLDELVNKQERFSILVFKLINLDNINRYVDYSIGEKTCNKISKILSETCDKNSTYSIYTDEFVAIIRGYGMEYAYMKAEVFLNYFKEPILINGIPVNLVIKGGIINYPLHAKTGNDLFKRMGRTLDQQEFGENKIAIYDNSISKRNKEKYETIVSLYEAIKKDRFSIVYQPIISLKSNEVAGAEALLRWDNSRNMNPEKFIKIAEDAGIVGEITKLVITKVIDQLKKWEKEGIKTKVAINISSKDLENDFIINYITEYSHLKNIESTSLEVEITERTAIKKEKKVIDVLNKVRDNGIKISLDDFGTGYNSLVEFVKLPIDYLKIDKVFIDNINDAYYNFLIKEIINSAHNLGKEVIAEGVETKEQLKILQSMNCDRIQGYYFSRPLTPEKLKEFILSFNKSVKTGEI